LELHGINPDGTKAAGTLACTSLVTATPADTSALLEVALHPAYVSNNLLNITSSSGVNWVGAELCQKQMEEGFRGSIEATIPEALLYFCGQTDLIYFSNASVRNVRLPVLSSESNASLLEQGVNDVISSDTYAAAVAAYRGGSLVRGLLAFAGGVKAVFKGAVLRDNRGPAIEIGANATVWVTERSVIHGHEGLHVGGAVRISLNGSLVITGASNVTGNRAQLFGGGIALKGSSRLYLDGNAVVANNIVQNKLVDFTTTSPLGGGIALSQDARVIIRGRSLLAGNVAGDLANVSNPGMGGSLFVADRGVVVIDGASEVLGSTASGYGGGVAVEGAAKLFLLNQSIISGNHALQGGGGISLAGSAQARITGAILTANVASELANSSSSSGSATGGSLLGRHNSSILINGGSNVLDSNATYGGGVCLAGTAVLHVLDQSAIRGNQAHDYGGGICLFGDSQVIIRGQSLLANNVAGQAGGSLYIHENGTVLIEGGSKVVKSFTSTWGGGVCLQGNAMMYLLNGSIISGNHALQAGGGISLLDSARVKITNASLADNVAGASANSSSSGIGPPAGGSLYGEGNSFIVINGGSSVLHSNAKRGGGVCLIGTAVLHVLNKSIIRGNQAHEDGGGIFIAGHAQIICGGASLWAENAASGHGGSMLVAGNAHIVFKGGSKVLDSIASMGGGFFIQDTAVLYLLDHSIVGGNRAHIFGGGIGLAGLKALAVFEDGALITNNTADRVGGGEIFLAGGGKVICKHSTISDNYCSFYGGGLSVQDGIKLFLEGCNVRQNTAPSGGGGIYIGAQANVSVLASYVVSNTVPGGCGGGIVALDNATVAVVHSSIKHNIAGSGGGVCIPGAANLSVEGDKSKIVNNSASLMGGGVALFNGKYGFTVRAGVEISGNHAGEGGQNVHEDPALLTLLGPSVVEGFASRLDPKVGLLNASVKVQGRLKYPCGQVWVTATMNGSLSGGREKTNPSGVADFQNIKLQGTPGIYMVQLQAPEHPEVASVNFTVHIRGCHVGEVTDKEGDVCEPCGGGTFSLNPANHTCDNCPADATCPGGSVIVPMEGFWHSSNFSPQIHRYGWLDELQ
jgi:hypothetical protein